MSLVCKKLCKQKEVEFSQILDHNQWLCPENISGIYYAIPFCCPIPSFCIRAIFSIWWDALRSEASVQNALVNIISLESK